VDIISLDSTKLLLSLRRNSSSYFLSDAEVDAVVDAAGVELVEELSELEDDDLLEAVLSLEDFGLALP
jgi:hypothetical protein